MRIRIFLAGCFLAAPLVANACGGTTPGASESVSGTGTSTMGAGGGTTGAGGGQGTGTGTGGQGGGPSVCATPSTVGVLARRTEDFLDTIGVNVHIQSPVYDANFDEMRDKLVASGIRFIRDGYVTDTAVKRYQELAGHGIRLVLIANPRYAGIKPTADYWAEGSNLLLVDFLKNKVGPGVVEAVEIMNEIDLNYPGYKWHANDADALSGDPASDLYWPKYTRAITQSTHDVLKADPATAGYKIYGPSLTSGDAFAAVGDLSAFIDASNVHWYLANRWPETPGWGDNGYGSLGWQISSIGHVQAPNKPVVTTEGSYADHTKGTTEDVSGRYLPRWYFTAFNGGLPMAMKYELIDEGTDPQDAEQNFGLLRNDLSEKPAFTALKNLLGLFPDPGPACPPGALDFHLTGATDAVESTLLTKNDGRFYLALWLGKSSFDPDALTPIAVPDQAVTLALPATVTSVKLHTLDAKGVMTTATRDVKCGTLDLSVADTIAVVEIPAP